MLARLWHGRTPTAKADEYLEFLRRRAVPDYRRIPGNLSVELLRRAEGDVTHFLIVTRWESLRAVEAFAGADVLRAKYYPEDAGYLLEYEPQVQHYDVAC